MRDQLERHAGAGRRQSWRRGPGINWRGPARPRPARRDLASRQRRPDQATHLFAYGAHDSGASLKEARALFKEVSAVSPGSRFMAFGAAGQHWSLERNRSTFRTAVEAFLARHTGR